MQQVKTLKEFKSASPVGNPGYGIKVRMARQRKTSRATHIKAF